MTPCELYIYICIIFHFECQFPKKEALEVTLAQSSVIILRENIWFHIFINLHLRLWLVVTLIGMFTGDLSVSKAHHFI